MFEGLLHLLTIWILLLGVGSPSASGSLPGATTASPVEDIPQPASIPLVSRERYRFGQLIRQEDAQGNTNQFVYGKFNRLKDTIVAGAGTTTREYHPNGLLHKLIAPDGRTTQFDYDDVGRLDVQTTGETTRQRHDSRNRLTHVWGSAVQPVHFTYDDLNRRTHINRYSQGSFNSVSLPAAFGSPDHTTEFVLEPATGLLKEKIYPNDKSTVYTYTDDGLPETRTWERGITRTNVYNSARQLVQVLYNDDTPPIVLANYDRQGRFRSVFDAQGFRIFEFNAQSQPKLEHMLSGITGASYQLDYRRNDPLWPGRLNRIELRLGTFYSAPIEGLLHTSFDELGRPDTLDFTGGNGTEHVEYDYHPQRGWVTDRDYIGGSSGATTVRNPVSGVIDSKTNDRGGASGLISRFTGEYTDRLERDFLGVEGAMVGAGYHFDYEHDTRQRLTEAHKRSGLTSSAGLTDVPRSTDYDYDLAGNRTELTIGTNDFGYSVNELNQVTAISSNGTNLAVLLYDADGNLTNDGAFVYDYDAENRLVLATPLVAVTGSLAVVSQYDYLDRRFLKEVYRWEAAGWQMARRHHFIWDRNLPVYEKQEDGSGQVIREINYGWGLDLSESRQGAHGVGGLQMMFVSEAGTTRSYSCWYDLNGNLTELVNESGAIAAHYQYNAYGQVIGEWADTNDSFAVSNAFGFSTKYTDKETGLVYFGRRFYSPMLGRWMNRDPIEESGGYNLYAYGLNDPVNRFDPNGEVAPLVALWAAAKVAAFWATISGTTEIGLQFYEYGEVRSWRAVAGHAALGGLTAGAGSMLARGAGFLARPGASAFSRAWGRGIQVGMIGGGGYFAGKLAINTYQSGQQYGWSDPRTVRGLSEGVMMVGGFVYGAARGYFQSKSFNRYSKGALLNEIQQGGYNSGKVRFLRSKYYQFKYRKLIGKLNKGDVRVSEATGAKSKEEIFGLMGRITAATEREVALLRVGKNLVFRMGPQKKSGRPGTVSIKGANRVIAHTHPNGILGLSMADYLHIFVQKGLADC